MKLAPRSISAMLLAAVVTSGAVGCSSPSRATPVEISMATPRVPPSFSVTGAAKLQIVPDCADVAMTISGEGTKSAAAAALTKERQRKLVELLQAAGIQTGDIKLSSVQLTPVIDYNRNGEVVSRRFRSETHVVVTTKDFTKISDIFDAGAAAGISTMSSSFRKESLDELKKQVRDMALNAAKAKAKQMATNLGFDIGPVIGVVENSGGYMWQNAYFPQVSNSSANAPSADSATQLAVDTQELNLDISVTYEFKR